MPRFDGLVKYIYAEMMWDRLWMGLASTSNLHKPGVPMNQLGDVSDYWLPE